MTEDMVQYIVLGVVLVAWSMPAIIRALKGRSL